MVMISRQASPSEACGIACLTPDLERIGLDPLSTFQNVHRRPEVYFQVEWEEFWEGVERYRRLGIPDQELICWHSHPRTRAHPSLEDIDFMQRTGFPMAIVSLRATVPLIRIFVAEQLRPKVSEVGAHRVPALPLVNFWPCGTCVSELLTGQSV